MIKLINYHHQSAEVIFNQLQATTIMQTMLKNEKNMRGVSHAFICILFERVLYVSVHVIIVNMHMVTESTFFLYNKKSALHSGDTGFCLRQVNGTL